MNNWKVIGASVAGTSHLKYDQPCQDAHRYTLLENETLLIAVADGAGSAEQSQLGAVRAVEAAISQIHISLDENLPSDQETWEARLRAAFADARQAVLALAEELGTEPRQLACTLSLAIAAPNWLVTGQIGDGIIVAQNETGELFTAITPQQGEYAGETFFLTMEDALDRLEGRVYPVGVGALAVMTDGLSRLAMNLTTGQPHTQFFAPLLAFPNEIDDAATAHAELASFLSSRRVNTRTDDDKTLVLATRLPAAGEQSDCP